MKKLIFAFFCSTVLAACGGGGGGSSSGGSGNSGGGSSTGVRLMHAGLDVSPLELHSSISDKTLQSARFSEGKSYSKLSSGSQLITASRKFAPSAVFAAVNLNYQGGKHSLLVFGGIELGNRGMVLINDGASEIPEGVGMVRVVNGLIDSSPVLAELAGISTSPASFASAGAYTPVPPGEYPFSVRESGSGSFDSGVIQVETGASYSILVAGQDNYFSDVTVFRD